MTRLIATGAASAPAAHALDLLILFQLLARHAANARAIEIGLLCLDTPQTAKLRPRVSKESSPDIFFDGRQNLPFHTLASSTSRSDSHPRIRSSAASRIAAWRWLPSRSTSRRCNANLVPGLDVSMRLCGPPTAQVVNQKRWAGLTFAALSCGQCGFLLRLFSCPAKAWPCLLTHLAWLLTRVHTYAGA